MKAKLIWIAMAAALIALIGYRVSSRKSAAAAAEAPRRETVVQTASVSKGSLEERITFTGTIRPRNEVEIFAKLQGRVESVAVAVGDKVKAGQLLATVEHREIAWQSKAAGAAEQVATANLESAQTEFDRTQKLFQGGALPQAQLDQAKTRLTLAQAQLAQAQAQAGLSQQQVSNARVESPITGTVVKKNVNVGIQTTSGTSIFTIQDVGTLKLETSVDANAYARLKKGTQAQVSVDSLPKESFLGTVTLLSPTLDAQTRRASIELEIDNSAGKLLPNMFATAEVRVGQVTDALVVPKEAVLIQPEGATVFRVKNGKAEAVRAVVGAQDGKQVQILSGLSEGDQVVVGGLTSLADGVEVKVADPSPTASTLTAKE